MTTLDTPDTPFAVVDTTRLDRNIQRLHHHLDALGVPLRLHVKTSKSVDIARRVHPDGPGPITVSTLGEAEYFADAGYRDILYAVGIDRTNFPASPHSSVAASRSRSWSIVQLRHVRSPNTLAGKVFGSPR